MDTIEILKSIKLYGINLCPTPVVLVLFNGPQCKIPSYMAYGRLIGDEINE